MFVKNEVGSRFYIWTIGGGMGNRKKQAVISAHGGQVIMNGKCPKSLRGWVDLAFYCPNGYLLKDPSLNSVLKGRVTPHEIVACGVYQDYSLSKFQGAKHGSAEEAYDKIEETGITKAEVEEKYKIRLQTDDTPPMDVITMRHRRGRSDMTLFEVLAVMKDKGWTYDLIHCSFCRGPSGLFSTEKGSHDATTNKPL